MSNVTNEHGLNFDLPGDGPARFTLQHFNGDVTIEGWERNAITVRTDDDDDNESLSEILDVDQRGNEVRISLNPGGRAERRAGRDHDEEDFGRNWEALRKVMRHIGRSLSLDLHIALPYNCDVTLRTVNGDLEIRRVQGKLYVENAAGDIQMTDIRGSVLVKSASGDVEINRLQGRLGIQTASGDLTVDESELGALSVRTASGDLNVTAALRPAAEYEIQTISGDIDLNIPVATRAVVDFETISGDLHSEVPHAVEKLGRRHRLLQINGGGDTRIRIRTTSGDVSINKWHAGQVPARAAAAPADDGEGEGPEPTRRFTPGEVEQAGAAAAGGEEHFRAAATGDGEAGEPAPTQRLDAPHKSAEMAILDAIESGEMSVEDGLRRLSELAQ